MFSQMRIINIKSKECKIIEIEDFTPGQLNSISAFYENHPDYEIERY